MAVLVTKAQTTITVTIKQPPLFEGASLLITESATAKKEFNITFSNLLPDARRLIESTANQQQLRQALIDKGYVLHMVSVEEAPRTTRTTVAAETPEEERRSARDEREASTGENAAPFA